ncbi:MAG: UDP-galactopyranose mutase [Oscillospiraceae bacterium]|nr:UDP-galactopyranose mutase [Oscillospiraceae bacterium]
MDYSEFDCIVIGCGLTGSVIARELADTGKKVVILERRTHIGGNMYDYIDEHGFLVQKYGPHTFHTTKKELYDYMCRFEEWDEYKLICGAFIDGKCTPTPFNFQTIDDFYSPNEAEELKAHIKAAFGDRTTATVVEVMSHSDPLISVYAKFLFENDYSLYTAKQWGVSPSEIDVSVLNRVPLRFSYDVGYFDDEFQVMPKHSFTRFFENLLDHKNITVELGVNALEHIKIIDNEVFVNGDRINIPVVYTGAVDELFEYKFDKLPYRSLRFEWKYDDKDSIQDMPIVAYPQANGFTRITEYKKLPVQIKTGSSYAVEYPIKYDPLKETEPYYPVLTEDSKRQYAEYRRFADSIKNLYCCGRLGDFKYYNMDQALECALCVANSFFDEFGGNKNE